jgi:hypothetical protein
MPKSQKSASKKSISSSEESSKSLVQKKKKQIKKKAISSSEDSSDEEVVIRLRSTPRTTYSLPLVIKSLPTNENYAYIGIISSTIASYLNAEEKKDYYTLAHSLNPGENIISSDFVYIADNAAGDDIIKEVSKFKHLKAFDMSNCFKISGTVLVQLPISIISLNLSYCRQIHNDDLALIASHLTHLQTLILEECKFINDTGLEHLSICTALTTLDINGVPFATFNCLLGIENLTTLIVDNYNESDEYEDMVERDISALFDLKLTTLVFTNCSVNEDLHGEDDDPNLGKMTTLTSLDLSYLNDSFEETSCLLKHLSNLTNLTQLNLDGNFVNEDEILTTLPTSLKSLSLTYAQLQDEHSNTKVAYLTNLTTLNITIPSNAVIKALSTLVNLTRLNIENEEDYEEEDKDMGTISPIPNKDKLLSLTLGGGSLTEMDVLALTNLTSLDLSTTRIESISALSNLTSLLELKIYSCDKDPLKAISQLTSLEKLNLSLNLSRTKEEEKVINKPWKYNLLAHLINLRELDLGNHPSLLEKDVKYISKLNQLKVLDLSECTQLGHEALRYISKLYQLETLLFTFNPSLTTPKSMTFLSNIETLTKLELTQFIELKKGVKMPNITQTMFNSICSITSLIDLTLTDLPMANIKYVRLTKLTGLKKLELEYCDPDQVAFFTVLAQLPRLTVLRINPWQHNKSITKKLINHIATIPTLKYLNEDTDITPKKDYGSPNIRNISDDESNDNKSEDESNDNKSEDESND